MAINYLRFMFLFFMLFTGGLGVLLYYVEPYLPVLITRSYRYGKYAVQIDQPIVARLEVPKRWYTHFYIFGAPVATYTLYLAFHTYFYNGSVSENVYTLLNICLGDSRQAAVSPESTFIAIFLLTLHLWKRVYETQYVNVYSNKMMNVSHYFVGLSHYAGTVLCVIGESYGFVKGSKGHFSWERVTVLQLICAVIFILSSYAQLRANVTLGNLRKNKTGVVISTAYKVPHGGLFEYVSGALQLPEILIYVMLSVILWQSSTYHFVTLWVIVNQTETAFLTHQWYQQTFKSYPKSRKVLIPFLF